MTFDVSVAQFIATVTLNFALAIAVGAGLSALWLATRGSAWAASRRERLRRAGGGAVAVALLASVALLWLEAAAMAEVPVTEAGAAAWSMLSATHFGLSWSAGATALVLGAGAIAVRPRGQDSRRWILLHLSALAAFLYTRSLVSHAAADGDFGFRVVADWIHLILVSAWLGEVCVAGWLTLAGPPPAGAGDQVECRGYIAALSTSATWALGGIVATGVVNAWNDVGSPAALTGSVYGGTLLLKLALVAMAVLLGACNRFFVMPSLTAGAALAAPALRRFTLILRVETAVLLGVLVVAAVLSSTPPPGAG